MSFYFRGTGESLQNKALHAGHWLPYLLFLSLSRVCDDALHPLKAERAGHLGFVPSGSQGWIPGVDPATLRA